MLILTLNTPLKDLIAQKEVDGVQLPSKQGQIEILPHHVALTCALQPGLLSYQAKQKQRLLAVDQGYAQLVQGHLRIVVEHVWEIGEVNKEKCLQEKEKVLHLLSEETLSEEDFIKTELHLQRVQAQLNLLL